MASARIIDYYAILNVPPTADLAGIESAYARLSDELAVNLREDELGAGVLGRLNEAYSVLSRPVVRRDYDRVYFSREIERESSRLRADERRRGAFRGLLIGGLLLIVAVQGAALAYLGRAELGDAAEVVFGPLMPSEAN
ncbi:MAG: J domain-containing protein [Chloroflexota bacterium]